MRSSVEPHTIASETAQNANWNSNLASTVASDDAHHRERLGAVAGELEEEPVASQDRARDAEHVRAAEGERKADRPVADRRDRQVREDLRDPVPAFFTREKPISSIAKPACMNSTSTAAMNTNSVFVGTVSPSVPSIA